MKNVLNKLFNIQQELKVPKSQRNNFGNYNFRNCEDIMEASKPICAKHKCLLTCSDEIIVIGEHEPNLYEEIYYDKDLKKENVRKYTTGQQRFYVQATATLYDVESGESISVKASAREEETKKGMDASQITGASSSYARKYALNGLLQLDDNKDADTNEFVKQQRSKTTTSKSTQSKAEMVEEGQIKAIQILFNQIKQEGLKEEMYQKVGVNSSKELTKKQATSLIKALKRMSGETDE